MSDSRAGGPMGTRVRSLGERLVAVGQGHLVGELERLGPEERARFERTLAELDLGLVGRLRELARRPAEEGAVSQLEPPRVFPLRRSAEEERRAERARAVGARALEAGQVGFLVVAGGQASRLGLEGPKGAFPIGPVSRSSLFAIQARRLLAASRRHRVPVPWYVMTSPANDRPTREFFAAHGHFGLPAEDVFFFSQRMLPALDREGRVLLSGPGRLFLAPDGHGGVLSAFVRSGALEDARRRGIEVLSYFQVDNPLVRPADPLFLGLHLLEGAGMSSKYVGKRDPSERVGVLGLVGGRMGCIEYSDLPEGLRLARDGAGELAFRAGNIAVHLLGLEFLASVAGEGLELPWHLARKEIDVWQNGARTRIEGYKFETFVFDALGRSERSVTLEVDRGEEFSPVKNRTGEDSPETARADLCRLHASWARRAGLTLPPVDSTGVHPVEIDPLVAESLDELLARGPLSPEVGERGHLYR